MHMIVFSTLVGAPLAMLGLSSPEVAQRSCVFVIHPQITSETFKGREGQIVFPDRPTEYPCGFQKGKTGTVVTSPTRTGGASSSGWHATMKAHGRQPGMPIVCRAARLHRSGIRRLSPSG
jgi:hypothetical protein